MQKKFQLLINFLVLFMFVSWWVWPIAQSFLPYEDETTPDETLLLNEEIDALLAEVDPNFEGLYDNKSLEELPTLTYSSEISKLSPQENYMRSSKGIVYITIEDTSGVVYFGSGSIITSDGVIMTNYHVIEGATKVIVTTSAGQHYPATKVLATDELLDVAFIKIDGEGLTPLPIGDSETVQVGDTTLVIGHAEGFINTLSLGNVSGFRTYQSVGTRPQIQITNPISSGNSGGAVLNEYGEIIGIPTWTLEYDQNMVQVQNLNFAIPINEALALLR